MESMNVSDKRSAHSSLKTYEITTAAALAAISAALQLAHIGWVSPWGMWIDLVAVSWIVAYFLYGGRSAFVVSAAGALIITLFAPSTWLGAGMKWVATVPMFLIPVIMELTSKIKNTDFSKMRLLIPAVIIAILLRAAIVIPVNYYFAIPIWTGWTFAQAMEMVPWWAILLVNAIQGVLEVALAWLLVFRFKLDRFATWE